MSVTQQFNWSSVSSVGSVSQTTATVSTPGGGSTSAVTGVSLSGSSSSSYGLTHTHFDDEYLQILTTLNSYLEELVNITNDMKNDIQRLRERGENTSLGILTQGVTDLTSLERAVVINGIKKADLLEAVRAEVANPTPMPQ